MRTPVSHRLDAGADFLRKSIGFAAERLMPLEVDGLCGAPPMAKPGQTTPLSTSAYRGYSPNSSSAAVTAAIRALTRPDLLNIDDWGPQRFTVARRLDRNRRK